MSKYTTEVRYICENYSGLNESVDYDEIDDVISKSRTKIFDFSYPIFDEAYRPVLETKILTHYYTREICEETVGLWKLRLKAKMNEIMPYYNKLYESELIKFNPLFDADYQRIGSREQDKDDITTNNLKIDTKNSGTDVRELARETGGEDIVNSSTEKGGVDTTRTTNVDKYSEWNLYSDTPQGGIEGIQGAEDEPSLLDNGYLTNARHILHDGTGTNSTGTVEFGGTSETDNTMTYGKTESGTDTMNYGQRTETDNSGNIKFNGNTTEGYTEHVFGKMPGSSPSKMLKEFRDTFLNIDLDIIRELKNLFFNLW